MQDNRNCGVAFPAPHDVLEHAVLEQLLDAHPAVFTVSELKRRFVGYEDDLLDVAISALDAAGLVNIRRDLVFLSAPAVRCAELLDIR